MQANGLRGQSSKDPLGRKPRSQGVECDRSLKSLTILHHILCCPPVCFFRSSLCYLQEAQKLGQGLSWAGSWDHWSQTLPSPAQGLTTSSPRTQNHAQPHLGLLFQISLRLGTQKVEDLSRDQSQA